LSFGGFGSLPGAIGVLATDLAVDSMGDALAATSIAQDLRCTLIGLPLRVVARAGAVGPGLANDPVVSILSYVPLISHFRLLVTNVCSYTVAAQLDVDSGPGTEYMTAQGPRSHAVLACEPR
jgi:hypothetical protein